MTVGTSHLMIYKMIQNKIEQDGIAQIKVKGISMLPTLLPGDIITVRPSLKYRYGDILVYISMDGKIIVHRLMKVQKDIFITKGDRNKFYDEKVSKDRILGKVISWKSEGHEYRFTNNFFLLKWILYLSAAEVRSSSNIEHQKNYTSNKNRALRNGKNCIDGGSNDEQINGSD